MKVVEDDERKEEGQKEILNCILVIGMLCILTGKLPTGDERSEFEYGMRGGGSYCIGH